MKSSTFYFHIETKKLENFQIWISVPLNRLGPTLKLTSCSQKACFFLNFVEKYVSKVKKKKVNVIITVVIEHA